MAGLDNQGCRFAGGIARFEKVDIEMTAMVVWAMLDDSDVVDVCEAHDGWEERPGKVRHHSDLAGNDYP